jgi:hypothetical protein
MLLNSIAIVLADGRQSETALALARGRNAKVSGKSRISLATMSRVPSGTQTSIAMDSSVEEVSLHAVRPRR